MRVFVAGATGVIGIRLLPLLVAAGHDVAGMTRSPARAGKVVGLGAEPVVCDVFDADRLARSVVGFRPDVVVHQLTDLPDDLSDFAAHAEAHARIRREGTRNLIAAAAGARVVAQSVAWDLPGEGGEAVRDLEAQVLAVDGVVARYGQFYGPGTYYPTSLPDHPRIGVDDAARRTVPLLTAQPGVCTLVDEA